MFLSFLTFFPWFWATPPCGPSAHHASRSGFWTCRRDFVEQFGGARVRGSAQCRVLSCSHRHQRTGQCDLAKMDGCSSSSETYGKQTSCIFLRYCFGSYGCYSSVSGYPWPIAIVFFANCTWRKRLRIGGRISQRVQPRGEKKMKKVGITMVVTNVTPISCDMRPLSLWRFIFQLTTGTALPRTLLRIWPKINTRAAFRI